MPKAGTDQSTKGSQARLFFPPPPSFSPFLMSFLKNQRAPQRTARCKKKNLFFCSSFLFLIILVFFFFIFSFVCSSPKLVPLLVEAVGMPGACSLPMRYQHGGRHSLPHLHSSFLLWLFPLRDPSINRRRGPWVRCTIDFWLP